MISARPDAAIEDGGDQNWRIRSLCLQAENPDIFFDGGGLTHKAKKICRACPVREPCLKLSLANNERFGVWGGLTRAERKALLKRRSTDVALDDDDDDDDDEAGAEKGADA